MLNTTKRFQTLKTRIEQAAKRASRSPKEIKIIGVCKRQPLDRIISVLEEGLTALGENYAQEFLKKRESLFRYPAIEWHFVGKLQQNKVRLLIPHITLIHSVDSLKVAEEIHRRSLAMGVRTAVLVQVRASESPTTGGIAAADVSHFLRELKALDHLQLRGFMVQPPLAPDPEESRSIFRRAKALLKECGAALQIPEFKELSMGTSFDLEVAIEEGATMVRLGTILFGKRE